MDVDGVADERDNGRFQICIHGEVGTKRHHLAEADFDPHEASMMNWWPIADIDLGEKATEELLNEWKG